MIWYTLEQHSGEWIIFKNVENHAIGSISVFRGTRTKCEEYCERNQIKLGYNHRRKIKK